MNSFLVSGIDIPKGARYLTRRDQGVMQDWLAHNKRDMVAVLGYKKGILIGWSCYRRIKNFYIFPTNLVEISVFVARKHRKKRYGKTLLDKLLKHLKIENPKAIVRYGAPKDSGYFNWIYERMIKNKKLKSFRYFAKD